MKPWLLLVLAAQLPAQNAGVELFEKSIRPVLAAKCYACHSSNAKAPMGSLALDTKAGLRKGGASGPAIVAGNPSASRLMRALSYSDNQLRMPPTGKLTGSELAAFETWIAAGAPDPREDAPTAAAPKRG